jgi:hypothetical protein
LDAGDADPAFPIPLPGYGQPLAPGQARPRPDREYRTIHFGAGAWADLVGPGGQRLGVFLIQGGAQLPALVRPACGAQAEAADLLFEDGTTARGVPRAAFTQEGQAP